MPERIPVILDGERITALVYDEAGDSGLTLLLGHGANGDQCSPILVDLASQLAHRGVQVVTYNFPFAEREERKPDRPEVLDACTRAALHAARERRSRHQMFLGGLALGAQVAARVVAAGGREVAAVAGLVLLSYPLHRVGETACSPPPQPRTKGAPMLFVQGTRSLFGTPDELRAIVPQLPTGSELFEIQGADHALAPSASGGPTQREVDARIAERIVAFMQAAVARRAAARALREVASTPSEPRFASTSPAAAAAIARGRSRGRPGLGT